MHSAAKGTAHFIVTACSGGAPVSNASISIDAIPYAATLSDGTYDAVSTPGSHSYLVSKDRRRSRAVTSLSPTVKPQTCLLLGR